MHFYSNITTQTNGNGWQYETVINRLSWEQRGGGRKNIETALHTRLTRLSCIRPSAYTAYVALSTIKRLSNWFRISLSSRYALQMKGRGEFSTNVWFPFKYSQKWNCYFQNRIIMFCLPVPRLIYLWEIYIFPRLVCLFSCREICGPILGICNPSQTHECRNWDWGRAIPRKGIYKWDFPCSVLVLPLLCTVD